MTARVPRTAISLLAIAACAACASPASAALRAKGRTSSTSGGSAQWSPKASPPPTPAVPLGSGAWSWFAEPRALYYHGRFDRIYAGWVSPDGHQVIGSWDGSERRRTILGRRDSVPDDHSTPALTVLPDGRLMVFSSTHDGNRMRWRVMSRPEDLTAWGPQQILGTNTPGPRGYTYPNPIQLPAEGNRLYLFWRGGNWLPAYSVYQGGTGWSPARRLLARPRGSNRFTRPYIKYAATGNTIGFAFTEGHPRNERANSIHFALYRGGAFYRADGKRIGRLGVPLNAKRADLVYDGHRPKPRAWVHDVALTPSGRPVIVFATFRKRARRHEYRYAIWSRGRWRTHRIVAAGGPIGNLSVSAEYFYSGGISLDPENPSLLYLSRQVDGIHQVERWRTRDRGRHWRHRRLTGDGLLTSARPVVPRGLPAGRREVLWMAGPYTHYHHFAGSIMLTSPFGAPPEGSFEASAPTRQPVGSTVDFDPSTRPGASRMVSARWDFGDGQSAPAAGRTRHLYTKSGHYFPSLVVTDAVGRRDVLSQEIVIP
jgi:hypothetical protein